VESGAPGHAQIDVLGPHVRIFVEPERHDSATVNFAKDCHQRIVGV